MRGKALLKFVTAKMYSVAGIGRNRQFVTKNLEVNVTQACLAKQAVSFFCQTGYTHVRSHRIFFDKLLRLRTQRTHDTRKLVQITNSLVFCRTSFCGNGSGCRATKFVSDGMRKVMPQFLPQRINRISTKKIQVCREKTCNNHYEKFSESVGPRAVMCRPVPRFLFFGLFRK